MARPGGGHPQDHAGLPDRGKVRVAGGRCRHAPAGPEPDGHAQGQPRVVMHRGPQHRGSDPPGQVGGGLFTKDRAVGSESRSDERRYGAQRLLSSTMRVRSECESRSDEYYKMILRMIGIDASRQLMSTVIHESKSSIPLDLGKFTPFGIHKQALFHTKRLPFPCNLAYCCLNKQRSTRAFQPDTFHLPTTFPS